MTEQPQHFDATSVQDTMRTIGKTLKPVIESIVKLSQHVSQAMHQSYSEAGTIYGDTHEGMMRWIEECGKINRLRQEADYLEQQHIGLRLFRQKMLARQQEEHRESIDNA